MDSYLKKNALDFAKNNPDFVKKHGQAVGKMAYDNREAIGNYAYENREAIGNFAYNNRNEIANAAHEN